MQGDKGQPETNATDAILQPLVEDRCHTPGLDNTEIHAQLFFLTKISVFF